MNDLPFRPGRRFTFEVELEMTQHLSFAPGELAALLVEGLSALDQENRLFPGVTTPGYPGHVLTAGAKPMGYYIHIEPEQRPERRDPGFDAPQTLQTEIDDGICESLEGASFAVETVLAEQRMLVAKINAAQEHFRYQTKVADADRAHARKLLKASAAVVRHHETSIKPLL